MNPTRLEGREQPRPAGTGWRPGGGEGQYTVDKERERAQKRRRAAHTCQAGSGHGRARGGRLGALIVGGWGHSAIATAICTPAPAPMAVPMAIRVPGPTPIGGARAEEVRRVEVADGGGQGQRRLAAQAGRWLWSPRRRHVVEAHCGRPNRERARTRRPALIRAERS